MFLPVLSAPAGGGGKRAAPHGLYGIHRPVSAPGQAARRSRSFLNFPSAADCVQNFFSVSRRAFRQYPRQRGRIRSLPPVFPPSLHIFWREVLGRRRHPFSTFAPGTGYTRLSTRGEAQGPSVYAAFARLPGRERTSVRPVYITLPAPPVMRRARRPLRFSAGQPRLVPAGPGAALCRVLRRSSARLSLCAGPSFRSTR